MSNLQISIKPNFVFSYVLLQGLVISIIFVLFGASSLHPVLSDKTNLNTSDVSVLMSIFFPLKLCLIEIVIVTTLYTFWVFLTYRVTEYNFYKDYLTYKESFINIEEKDIKFSRIVEVNFRQNLFQRMFSIGTVILNTAATDGQRAGSGIKIKDLDEPRNYYLRIKEIVNNKPV